MSADGFQLLSLVQLECKRCVCIQTLTAHTACQSIWVMKWTAVISPLNSNTVLKSMCPAIALTCSLKSPGVCDSLCRTIDQAWEVALMLILYNQIASPCLKQVLPYLKQLLQSIHLYETKNHNLLCLWNPIVLITYITSRLLCYKA